MGDKEVICDFKKDSFECKIKKSGEPDKVIRGRDFNKLEPLIKKELED